jgi:tetratricopeptide (TPR) repeat protein
MDWSGDARAMQPAAESLARAEARYRAAEYAQAAALLAPLADTGNASALRLLGLTRLRQGQAAAAVALLAQAVALAPRDALAALHHGLALAAEGRHREAVAAFTAAARRDRLDAAPWLNMSGSLLALGDHAGAIRAARRGRLRAPTLAASHYTLGAAYLAAGFLEAAAAAFRRTTRLAPGFADGWVNLGVAAYRRGDIYAAKHAMREALRADPGNAAAAANLGSFMRLTGEVEAGEALLTETVNRNPNAAAARINLAAELLGEDRAAEALALLAAEVPPEMQQHADLQRALALLKLGRRGQALAILNRLGKLPPALEPLRQWRLVLAAQAIGNAAQAQRAAQAMAGGLEAPEILAEHRIMAHYDLAKFHNAAAPEKAFVHWQKGHDLLAQTQPFSRAAHQEFVDVAIELFSAARFKGPRAANQDEAPVFIVGMPRSGTTLAEQILAAHGEVHGAGERSALGWAFQRLGCGHDAAALRRIAALEEPALSAAGAAYLADLHGLAPDAKRIVDKMPGNFMYLGLMALLMPKARIISCLRDPRDIGMSIFTFRFYGVHPYAHNLDDLGWYIGQQRRLMAHWEAALPNPIFQLNLSDWVEDFDGTLRRVLACLGLPYDAACERFHEAERRVRTVSRAQVKEKVNARGLGRWRPYAKQLAPLIKALEESGAL